MKSKLLTILALIIIVSCTSKQEEPPKPSFEKDLMVLKEYFHIPGVAVVITKNDEVVYENYLGYADIDKKKPVDSTTIFPIASITKIFASTLIMKYVESGQLSLNEPISNYLENAGLSDSIKVKHILSHTSEGNPGDFFNYSPRFSALTMVLEDVGGKSFEMLIKEQILDPLSLKNTHPLTNQKRVDSLANQLATPYYFYGEVEEGHYDTGLSSSSGMASSASGISEFANALYSGQLIKTQSFYKMSKPFETTSGISPYGFGVFSQQFMGKQIIWGYGQEDCFSSLVMIIPEDGLALTLLANNNLMSDPARLINGDITYSLFALNFLKHYVFDLPIKSEFNDWQKPESINYDFASTENGAFYRQEILANALAATFMSQVDPKELERSGRLTNMAFEHFPGYTQYGNLSLMRSLSVLANSDPAQFGEYIESLGLSLLKQYEYNPYANIYLAYYYESIESEEKALEHYTKIAEAPNFRPFWYTLEALFFLGQHYKSDNPELAKNYFNRIVDIGWNMGGVVEKAKAELESL